MVSGAALRNTGWVGFQGGHPFDIVSRRQVVLDGCTTFSQRGFDHTGLMRLNQILRPRALMRHVYYKIDSLPAGTGPRKWDAKLPVPAL